MKKRCILLVLSLLLFARITLSQTGNEVSVTLMVPPPYSPYLSDYEGLLQNAIITLTNHTNTNLSLKLTGNMTGDNGFSAVTQPDYLPMQPITLAPFQTRTIVADRAALAFFDPNNIDLNGDPQMVDNVLRTGILPEGAYEICVRAVGYTSNVPLSAASPSGCTMVFLEWVSPPLLSVPFCGESLSVIQNTVIVAWLPVVTFPGRSNVVYDLYIVRVLLGQDPNDAVNAAINFRAGNPIVKEGLVASTYILTPADPPLEPGATYAYAVVARDPVGRVVFENGGRSEVCLFHTLEMGNRIGEIDQEGSDLQTGNLGPSDLSNAAPYVHLEGQLFYKFYGDSGDDAGTSFQMSQLEEIPGMDSGESLDNYGYQTSSGAIINTNSTPGLSLGNTYDQLQGQFPPVPSYLFNSVSKDGARPLKNMRVTFKAGYMTGNKPNPQSEADFRMVGGGCETEARGGNLEETVELYSEVLGTVWTNGQGHFNYSGFIDGNTGVLATGQVNFSDGSSGDVCHDTEGWGLYRVITMRVESQFYCDPDIVVFAQPYQTMHLPDLTVYVRSYNLELTVQADHRDFQQAGAGGPIRDARVRVGRTMYVDLPTDFPKNESRFEDFGEPGAPEGTPSWDFIVSEVGRADQNGKFTFRRLVQHPGQGLDNSPPCPQPDYLYVVDAQSDENIGNLNYGWKWNSIGPCEAIMSISKPKNASFVPNTYYHTMKLHPKFPEIYLQTKADYGNSSSGGYGNLQPLPYVLTNLWIFAPEWQPVQYAAYSDEGGLLRLNPFNADLMPVNADGVPDRDCQLDFWKQGFRCKTCPTGHKYLQWGERWTPTVILEPKGKVKGEVQDEFGEPVMSHVRVAEGPFVLTEIETYQPSGNNYHSSDWSDNLVILEDNMNLENPNGELQLQESPNTEMLPWKAVFETKAPTGNQIQIIVQPLESQYFADTFYVNIPEMPGDQAFDLGKLIVKQRLHRPRFEVVKVKTTTTSNGLIVTQHIAIPGAKVTVSNRPPRMTNAYGFASFVFASPEEEEFHVKVKKSDFIPYDQYLVIPSTKDPLHIKIIIEEAQSISGKVTDASNGQPIAAARVYAHVGTNEFGNITVEAFTNTEGEYTLGGLPGGEQSIFAAKSSSSKTYLGAEKNVFLPNLSPVNFQLQDAPFEMSSIWGLNVEIESSTLISAGKYKVDGAFVKIPDNARFKPEDEQLRLPFEDLEIHLVGGNGPSGKPKAEPVANKVVTTTIKTRAYLNNELLVEMSGPVPASGGSTESGITFQIAPGLSAVILHKMKVEKQSNGKGAVMAKVFTQLEDMNFAHQYNGQFYLGETANNPNLRVFQAGQGWSPQQSYHLFDYDFGSGQAVNPTYVVHNFPAFADRLNSYVRGDSFVLATTLIVDLPLSNPDKIYVKGGKIIVTPGNLSMIDGSQKIQFELETWKVEVNNWTFSETYGSIRGAGKIITNALTIPFDVINIRPDALILPNTNDIDLSTLSLAGVANLQVQNPVSFYLDYQGPGSIQHDPANGHWRMQLTNNSGYVAKISNLPGLSEDVKIGHIENYSDAFLNMVLPSNQVLNHYNVLSQTLENLYIHTDGFTLNGRVNTGIPNMQTATSADFTYYKEAGQIKMRMAGLNANFETTGQINFKSDPQIGRIKLQNNLLEILGWATIYDDESSRTIKLRTKIVKTPQAVKMVVFKISGDGETEGNNFQSIAMGGGSSKMKVLEGDQLVAANTWQPLHYRAELDGFGGGFQSGGNKLWFVVDGAITNDQSKGDQLKLTNIETPFGSLSLTFDFDDEALIGNMHVQNIPMGAMNILEGTLETRMSGKGFYLLCQMDALYPVIGQVRTNFIAGSYPSVSAEAQDLLTQGMHIKKLPDFLTSSGIQGMFVCANKPVVEIDFEVDLFVFAVGLYADAGVDARFWMNFGESYGGAHIGAMMYADIEAYVQVLVCDFCIGLNAELAADAEFQWTPSTNFSLNACGSVGVTASFCDVADLSETVRLDLGWDSDGGFDLDVTLGETCSGMSSSGGGCVHF